jgi:hypothetical protein
VKITTEALLAEAVDMVDQVKDEINPEDGHDMDTFDILIARFRIITETLVTAKWVEYKN